MATEDVSFEPVKRTRLVDEVTARLREMIISGKLPPGRQLLQIELADQLGVSRTPLREAFRVLESDGLVRVSNRNGTIEVVTYQPDDLREMYEIREVIDGLAARLAARQGLSKEAQAEFTRLLAEMRKSSRPYNPRRRTESHAAFHSLVIECSGNNRLTGFIPLVRTSSAALFLPFIEDPSAAALVNDGKLVTHQDAMDGAQQFHEQIAAAIIEGDERKAETVARRHILQSLKFVGRMKEWRDAIVAARQQESARSTPGSQGAREAIS
jgi:GntR family transcriptional regulator of vanillate catabolism